MLASELLAYIKVKKIYGDIENIDIKYPSLGFSTIIL